VEGPLVVTANRDADEGTAQPLAPGRNDELDLGDVDVDAFERDIRDRDRRRRTITAVALGLALAGAIAFAVVAVVSRPQRRDLGADDWSPPPSYMATTSSIPTVVDAGTAPPRPVPTAPHPSRLPMCREPTTPLVFRSMCQLDAPAAAAVFECERPEVRTIWPRAVSWGCPPIAPGQPRPISIELAFDRQGQMPGHGEVVVDGDSRLAPRTVIRKVKVTLNRLDRAAASEQVAHLRAAARSWGCALVIRPPYRARLYDRVDEVLARFEREHEERRRLAMEHEIDCGPQWGIRVRYHEIMAGLTVEAASPLGFELTAYDAPPLPPAQDSGDRSRGGAR
jgi:hypothetical protein